MADSSPGGSRAECATHCPSFECHQIAIGLRDRLRKRTANERANCVYLDWMSDATRRLSSPASRGADSSLSPPSVSRYSGAGVVGSARWPARAERD